MAWTKVASSAMLTSRPNDSSSARAGLAVRVRCSAGFGGLGPLGEIRLDAPHRLLNPRPGQVAQPGDRAQLLARDGQSPDLLGQLAPVGRSGAALIQVGLDRRGGPLQPVAGRLGELPGGPDL